MTRPSDILPSDALDAYQSAVAEFERAFCLAMVSKKDYTLRIEIRGDAGAILHIRNHNDVFRRPTTDAPKTHKKT